MSIKVMSWVWDNSPYEGKQLLIHLALADFADDDGYCWPSQETIARKSRCSVETVRTTTRRMQADGFLSIAKQSDGRGSSHKYVLKNPKRFGGSEKAQIGERNPQIKTPKPPNPSPDNRQEPSKKPIEDERPVCPYCKSRYSTARYHDCPAMNMRIRHLT